MIEEWNLKEEHYSQQITEYKVSIDQYTLNMENDRGEVEKLNGKLNKQIEMNEIQLGELKDANQEIDKLKIQLAEMRSEMTKVQTTKV